MTYTRAFFLTLLWFALLAAVGAAWLFYPRFVDWATLHSGWERGDLMNKDLPLVPGLALLVPIALGGLGVNLFAWGHAIENARNDERKRLIAKASLADERLDKIGDLQRDFETQQGALRAALLERTQLREENARQGHEIAKLKAERAVGVGAGLITGPFISGVGGNGAGGSVSAFGPGFQSVLSQMAKMQPDEHKRLELVTRSPNNYTIRVPAGTRSCKILWPNGEVTVYDAEKGAWPEKMKEGAPEPAAVGGQVPYRIKAEPLKISDLREGDEIVFMGASTEIGVARVLHPFLQGDLGCCNLEIKVVIEHRKGGPQYTITEKQVLGVLRRIGS